MFPLRPEPQTSTGRGATGASGALIGRSSADFFNQKRVDPSPRIESGDARLSAVDYDPHALDRERSFRDVRSNDRFALRVTCQRGVLLRRWQFSVERQRDKLIA